MTSRLCGPSSHCIHMVYGLSHGSIRFLFAFSCQLMWPTRRCRKNGGLSPFRSWSFQWGALQCRRSCLIELMLWRCEGNHLLVLPFHIFLDRHTQMHLHVVHWVFNRRRSIWSAFWGVFHSFVFDVDSPWFYLDVSGIAIYITTAQGWEPM